MTLRESIIDGLADVRAHKLRTFLQTLGVILGVGSLVAVQGLVDSGRRQATKFFDEFGGLTKVLVVNRPLKQTLVTAKQLASAGLTWSDAEAIRSDVPNTTLVDPIATDEMMIRYGDYERRNDISGATPDYSAVYKFYPAKGRFLIAADMASQARVCVLGDTAARRYFGNEDPLGRILTIGDVGFKVVGVMKRKEFFFGDGDHNALEWMNRETYIPLTSLYARFTGDDRKRVQYINVIVDKVENNPKAASAIEAVLRRRHGGVRDFEVINRAERLRQRAEQNQMFNTVFLVSGIVSLLVGGIVIMNIMLASFRERIREVGVRKAMGARGIDIAIQFLVESILVTVIGGSLGLGLGVIFAQIISNLLGQPAVITMQMAVISVAASVSVGLFFGLYPAVKASRLNPVEALRYE
ncbi:MAG TPA: ABC transporter permease [Candidatus Polarisedimenticolia bacterium]|nr:ABC transporter permease [Candidatus Polarisedimenticolia bacterium]